MGKLLYECGWNSRFHQSLFTAEIKMEARMEIWNMQDLEQTIMQLIIHAGDARSFAIEAIRLARKGEFDAAETSLKECDERMNEAHKYQSELLFSEANGNTVPTTLLLVHAQDHVMNAMTVRDMAVEMVGMMKEQREREK